MLSAVKETKTDDIDKPRTIEKQTKKILESISGFFSNLLIMAAIINGIKTKNHLNQETCMMYIILGDIEVKIEDNVVTNSDKVIYL